MTNVINDNKDIIVDKATRIKDIYTKLDNINTIGKELGSNINKVRQRIDNILSAIGELSVLVTVILVLLVHIDTNILLALVSLSIFLLSRNVFILELGIRKLVNKLTDGGPAKLEAVRIEAGELVRELNELQSEVARSTPTDSGGVDKAD